MTNGAAALFMRTAYQNAAIYFGDTPLGRIRGRRSQVRWAAGSVSVTFLVSCLQSYGRRGRPTANHMSAPRMLVKTKSATHTGLENVRTSHSSDLARSNRQ